MDLAEYLTKQYHHLLNASTIRLHTGVKTTEKEWELINSIWETLLDLGFVIENKGKRKKKRRDPGARPKKLSPSVKKKIRRQPIRYGADMYMWTTHGADDYMCLRYEGTIWNGNRVMPEPGDSNSMNDSHKNCQCTMEFIGKAGSETDRSGKLPIPKDAPRPPWLDT